MKATIEYVMQKMPHPWDEERRDVEVWALCKVVRPEGQYVDPFEVRFEPIALFNMDSEAALFQRHLIGGGAVEADKQFAKDALDLEVAILKGESDA